MRTLASPFFPLARLAGAVAAAALTPGVAHAYCRSTTCVDGAEACPRDANGCKTTGHPLYWKSLCVGFSVQKDGTMDLPFADVQPVIEASFVTWSDLVCGGGTSSLAFSRLANVACHQTEYNPSGPNANVIMFQDNKWSYTPAPDPASVDDTLAKTTVTFDVHTGEILDADIELNSAYNEFTVGDAKIVYDLQSVLTHEIGHFIGLDHSLDPDATMNASYIAGDTSIRSLAPDDIAAACAVYPPGRSGTCVTTPRGGFADACVGGAQRSSHCSIRAGAPSDPAEVVSIAFVFGAVAARRRRRSA